MIINVPDSFLTIIRRPRTAKPHISRPNFKLGQAICVVDDLGNGTQLRTEGTLEILVWEPSIINPKYHDTNGHVMSGDWQCFVSYYPTFVNEDGKLQQDTSKVWTMWASAEHCEAGKGVY